MDEFSAKARSAGLRSLPTPTSPISSVRSVIFCGHNQLSFDKERDRIGVGDELRPMEGGSLQLALQNGIVPKIPCP